MRRARRFPQRLVRWTSLCVCFALILTSVAMGTFSVAAGSGSAARRNKQVANAPEQSNSNDKAKKVNATPPQPGPPVAKLPNLDEVRRSADEALRNGGRQVNAPQPIPSTQRRRRGGRASSKMAAQASNLLLADVSRSSRRKELKADVWSSLSTRTASDPISDSPISLFSSLTTNGAPEPQGSYNFPMARLDPHNRTGTGGEDLLSNNFNWNLPLLGLSGRGLDLGLTLSYNSLVWTRSGNYVNFDVDDGSIAPGFRLGFPTVEGPYWNDQAGAYFYLMVMPSGERVELRRIGSSTTYESADSAHLQLIDYGTSLLVRPMDGTQLNFVTVNYAWRCNQIKDRNGNYLSISYNSWGDVASITDTLSRIINFNYDGYDNLTSITQSWNGQTHQWATFGYNSNYYVGHNFPSLTSYGPDGSYITVLTQVGLSDGSRYNFEYNNTYGQVSTVRYYAADNHQRRYTTYAYSGDGSDCPRISERHDWAENWNGDYDDVPASNEEAVTQFTHDQDGACRMTTPDATVYKEYYGSTWQSGLTTQSEIWSGGVRQKWTTSTWTQDNSGVNYLTNPRVTETNIYDVSGNRRRAQIAYTSYNLPNSVALPSEMKEFAANGTSVLRRTTKTYIDGQAYIDRRVLGLLREEIVYDENNQPVSKVWYDYDWGNEYWEASPQAATQHDASGDQTGRGNLCWIGRWDITDVNNFDKSTRSYIKYNRTGSVIRAEDHYGRGNTISYADSYSDSVNRNTFAYPTTVTDADGYSSYSQFNYDFGAVTRTQDPPPAGQSQGAIQTMSYDGAGRILRVDTPYTGAYTRWDYAPYSYVSRFDTIQNGAGEQYTTTVWDGGGRVRATGGSDPGSSAGYWGKFTIYDVMGRPNQQTNPAEINGGWTPSGDDAAGWILSFQSYDWKGRPLVTTNADGTQKYASYTACGCAGSEVTTLTDEVGRQQRIYSDVLGRTAKTEVLNWDSSVYSTTANTYNARDQVSLVRQYQGADTSGIYQDTTMSYDGYGRLQSKHVPQQNSGTATNYAYNADDTIYSVTDGRGATCTYGYNGRREVTSATHTLSGQGTIALSYGYDAVGNRISMTDGLGSQSYSYNQLSQMTSETRTFTGLNSYTINYGYNLAGELSSVTDPFNAQVVYNHDSAGRVSSITGSGFANVSTYASNIQYRAWGGTKHLSYGNNLTMDASYNSRLQATSFTIPNVINKTYQYNNDGSLGYSHDLIDQRFDRAYSYDQSARITQALSGAEARGGSATNDRPYKQSYSYDAVGHLTAQNSNHWVAYFSAADTYSNNRRTGWSYDGDGNLLTNYQQTYTYDAAGQMATAQSDTSTTQGFDGNGRRVKSDETAYTDNGTVTTTTYYVRSSVLGGQVLTELTSAGAKQRTFVYSGSQVLAWQESPYGSPRVIWEHRDPSNASFRMTDVNGSTNTDTDQEQPAELDPLGSDAGTYNPYLNDLNPPDENNSMLPYPSFSDPRHPGTTFSIDGVRVPMDFFMLQLDIDTNSEFGIVEAFAKASTRAVGYRNSGVSWGTPFEATYDTHGNTTSLFMGEFNADFAGVNYGDLSPIYNDTWSFISSLLPQKTNPCAVNTQLPADGLGYELKAGTSRTRQYGTALTIAGLQNLAATWAVGDIFNGPGNPVTLAADLTITIQLPNPTPPLRIGEIGILGGGQFGEHKGPDHKAGTGADIGLFRSGGKNVGGDYQNSNYDQATTQRFLNMLDSDPNVTSYYFNDPGTTGTKLRRVAGHDNHIHVNFTPCDQ